MKYWLVPSNDHIFRIGDAMQAQGGLVDWRMSNEFSIGDIVFVYKTSPEQYVRYKMEVVGIGLNIDEAYNQEEYWTDKDTYYNGLGGYKYVRFKLLGEIEKGVLSLDKLREYGVKGNIQSVIQCKKEELIEFLLHPQSSIKEDYGVDYPEDDESLYEGALMKVKVNKYERNQKARRECVEKKGYKCLVCGKDFEATYGEIGKEFIHVHHLTPISSIGKEYELNVDTDLAPVCPNCHYMLHRKNPPYTIEELQGIMAKKRKSAQTVLLRPEVFILHDVDDDEDVRRLIHNMMALRDGTTILDIMVGCMQEFHNKYMSMTPKNWLQLVREYVRKITHNEKLDDIEQFSYSMVG